MRRLFPLLLSACVLTVLFASGCGNACLQLADKICSCQPDDSTKATCQARAREQEGIFPVNKQQEQHCQQLIDSNACDCQRLTTPEGRVACGLSYPPGP